MFDVTITARQKRPIAITALCLALTGCGGASSYLSSSPDSPGIGSRFRQLFGSTSQDAGTPAAAQPQAQTDLTCPGVSIRSGASTLAVGPKAGETPNAAELRYQGTITRTARDCNLTGGQITARIGIEGRVIVGPAGAPPQVDIPLRIAVVQETIQEKIVFTRAYRTTVAIPPGETSVAFSFVAEDVVYPVPTSATGENIFYVGFDPAGLRPEPKTRGKKK